MKYHLSTLIFSILTVVTGIFTSYAAQIDASQKTLGITDKGNASLSQDDEIEISNGVQQISKQLNGYTAVEVKEIIKRVVEAKEQILAGLPTGEVIKIRNHTKYDLVFFEANLSRKPLKLAKRVHKAIQHARSNGHGGILKAESRTQHQHLQNAKHLFFMKKPTETIKKTSQFVSSVVGMDPMAIIDAPSVISNFKAGHCRVYKPSEVLLDVKAKAGFVYCKCRQKFNEHGQRICKD